ncbi:MAG: hypothetical protein ACJ70V_08880 [Nitrososphaera sp.]
MQPVKYKSKISDSTAITTMTDQFTFLRDKKRNAAAITVAAISLGVLLLLPASLGFGGTIVQEAFAQFNLPLLEDQGTATGGTDEGDGDLTTEGDTGTTTTTTTPPNTTTTPPTTTGPPATTANTVQQQDLSTYMMASTNIDAVRGFIGSTLPTQGASSGGGALTATDGSGGHVATGRFRLFANDTSVRRFVAEMNIAAIDGSSFHNVTIREGAPHRFEVTAGNATTGTGSDIVGNVFLDGGPTPVIDNVPMRLSINGQTLAIQDIDIDETRLTDPGIRDILGAIDGQTIYGTIPRA